METPVVHTMEQSQYNSSAKYNTGKVEIVIRVICTLFCVGVVVPAALALPAAGEVEDMANDYGVEYEDADSYKAAAGWLLLVGSAAIAAHIFAIVFYILYMTSVVKLNFKFYIYINGILCVFFILSLLSGGIANSVFAAENGELWTDNCVHISYSSGTFCQSLQRITDAEAASAAFSFLSMILFSILFFVVVGSHLATIYKLNSLSQSQDELCSSSDVPPPYDSLNPPPYEATLTMSYAPMDAPPYEPEADAAQ